MFYGDYLFQIFIEHPAVESAEGLLDGVEIGECATLLELLP